MSSDGELVTFVVIFQKFHDCRRHAVGLTRLHKKSGNIVLQHFGHRTDARGDDGNFGGHRFQNGPWKSLLDGRQNEHIKRR